MNTATELSCPQCGAPVPLPEWTDLAVCGSCGSTLERERTGDVTREPPDRTATVPAVAAAASTPHVAAPTPRVPSETQALHSVRCSQCGGPLGVHEGRRILVCDRCGVRVVVKEHGGFSRWYFPPRVDRPGAVRIGAAWLKQYPGITRRARVARFTEAQLVYAPIWEHKALVAGWEFGYKLRTHYELIGDEQNERLDLRLARERVEEPRLQERRFYQAATDLEALGATRPRITGRELVLPLLAGELDDSAIVLDVKGAADEVAAQGRRAALEPVSGGSAPDTHLFAFRESTTLLYYPLWLLHYEEGNRFYRVVVNGRDGTVNSATAPAANAGRVVGLAATVGALAVIVALLVWLGVTNAAGRVSALVSAVIVSAVVVLVVRRFRVQGEVEYHEPFSS